MAPEAFIDTLVNRCSGVWIYLKYVLDDVRDGNRAPVDVTSLPQGLPDHYLQEFQQRSKIVIAASGNAPARPGESGGLDGTIAI